MSRIIETETDSDSVIIPDQHLINKSSGNETVGSLFRIYVELSKPRILVLILLIAIAGFAMATPPRFASMLLLHMIFGVGLLAAGVGALNQFFERDTDSAMRRTEKRPLPAGRISSTKALLFGSLTSTLGICYLALTVNMLTAALGIFTLISYVFFYTPLKRRTSLSTVIGAFPGAIPPIIGWVAVRNEISIEAAVLFLIMFLWQFPHFLAIAWMYREDYARAGIRMLPVVEKEGYATSRQIVLYAVALVPVSMLPTLIGMAGPFYFFAALLLSLAYLYYSLRTAINRTGLQAKRLLQVSILYLPLLFIIMLLDKKIG